MDIISHALIGAAIGEWARGRGGLGAKPTAKDRWRLPGLCALFAAAPDFPQAVFLYPYVASVHGRPNYIPENADWDHFRDAHAYASAIWEMPHSFFFLALVVTPLVLRSRLPRACIAAYASHLLVDLLTHTGEWSVAPFWPLPWRVEGFSDPWRWTPAQWALSISACALLWAAAAWLTRRRRP